MILAFIGPKHMATQGLHSESPCLWNPMECVEQIRTNAIL